MNESNVNSIELFEGNDGAWFWRAKAANGEIVAQSEGYYSKSDAKHAANATFPAVEVNEK
jgi:uncharacterized protein YegP (UPF0339 family)